MTEYVLDTSAIQGISRERLERAAQTATLKMCPLSFWELASHLDEVVGEDAPESSFRKRRGQVLKCRVLGLLDDPFAEHAVAVGAEALVNPSRFEDRLVIPQVLDALDACETLADFSARTVEYPSGERAGLKDLGVNARRVLAQDEEAYRDHVRRIAETLSTQLGIDRVRTLSDDDFVKLTFAASKELEKRYQDDGVATEQLSALVASSVYLHAGYKLARATKALISAGGNLNGLAIDSNDFEDGAIVLHIGLVSNRTLVTSDLGAIKALERATGALRRSSEASGLAVPTFCGIVDATRFLQEVGAA